MGKHKTKNTDESNCSQVSTSASQTAFVTSSKKNLIPVARSLVATSVVLSAALRTVAAEVALDTAFSLPALVKTVNRLDEAILHKLNEGKPTSYGLNILAFLFVHAKIQIQGVESNVDFGIVRMKEILDELPDTLN
jgi:hypothetical protein